MSSLTSSIPPRSTGRKFKVTWHKFVPFMGLHHVVMMLIAIESIFLCIMIAGCTSDGLRNVYLLSLSYEADHPSGESTNVSTALAGLVGNNTSLQVRVGFMGLCVSLPSGDWSCSSSVPSITSLVKDLAKGQNESSSSYDPLDLVNIAKTFKDEIIFDGLLFITLALTLISFCILSTFPGWVNEADSEGSEREVRPFPSRRASNVVASCLFVSALVTLLSVFWQHLASAGAATLVQTLTAGAVKGGVGSVAMGLGWAAVSLNILIFLSILIMILSIRVLLPLL